MSEIRQVSSRTLREQWSRAGTDGSAFFDFDLPAVFRCAVELGAAIAAQAEGAENKDADNAAERLLHVPNPRQAKFPKSFDWIEFQALKEIGAGWTRGEEPRPGWAQEVDLADDDVMKAGLGPRRNGLRNTPIAEPSEEGTAGNANTLSDNDWVNHSVLSPHP